MGKLGAGKSTMLAVMLRLVNPLRKGSVSINGIDTSTIGLKLLRSSLAMIPQETILTDGTGTFFTCAFTTHTNAPKDDYALIK